VSKAEPELTQADFEALARFRHAIRRYLAFAERGAREVGLTSQQHQALLAIKTQNFTSPMPIGELAKRLLLRPHSAAELVDRLVAADVIARGSAPHDRRVVNLRLTTKGEDLLKRLSKRNLRELRAASPALETLIDRLVDPYP
jgi:DNA-binding MarR family transcriptional regulator